MNVNLTSLLIIVICVLISVGLFLSIRSGKISDDSIQSLVYIATIISSIIAVIALVYQLRRPTQPEELPSIKPTIHTKISDILPTAMPDSTEEAKVLYPYGGSLFIDNFENIEHSQWLEGDFGLRDGKLRATDQIRGTIPVDSNLLSNYRLTLDDLRMASGILRLYLRMQNEQNFVLLECTDKLRCVWYVVNNNKNKLINEADFTFPTNLVIEVDGNEYRTIDGRDESIWLRFQDATFSDGKFYLSYHGNELFLDNIEIRPLH